MTGQVVTSTAGLDSRTALAASWRWSRAWNSATSGPVSTMMLRTELSADQRLDAPGHVALPRRRSVGTEQVLAQFPRGRRAPLALPPDDVFRHALADDVAGGFSGLGAIAIEHFLQFCSQ